MFTFLLLIWMACIAQTLNCLHPSWMNNNNNKTTFSGVIVHLCLLWRSPVRFIQTRCLHSCCCCLPHVNYSYWSISSSSSSLPISLLLQMVTYDCWWCWIVNFVRCSCCCVFSWFAFHFFLSTLMWKCMVSCRIWIYTLMNLSTQQTFKE